VFPEPVATRVLDPQHVGHLELELRMKDFSNAAFAPDQIDVMQQALERAVATLPHPVSSQRVQTIAESILRTANQGERDVRTLQTMALVEMQLRCDENV
jgi:hypothetical protein